MRWYSFLSKAKRSELPGLHNTPLHSTNNWKITLHGEVLISYYVLRCSWISSFYGWATKLGFDSAIIIPHITNIGDVTPFLLLLAASQTSFLRYPGRIFHSKQKPLSLAARSILLPQNVNGLSEGNLHRFTKTKTLSLPFSGEIVGQLSMEFFHS